MYKDYLERMSKESKKLYESILSEYNFDYGIEFEIALCKLLRLCLPKKFSICRGFIVSENDAMAGDDIIIYDENLFPKVRLIEEDLSVKQYIPAEAVFAYIEAKHTLYLDDKNKDSNLNKACEQVMKAKAIKRDRRELHELEGFNLMKGSIKADPHWPEYRNPMYGCIISRHVKSNISGSDTDKDLLLLKINEIFVGQSDRPDLVIAGDRILCLPVIPHQGNKIIESPFFISDKSELTSFETENTVGIGLMSLLNALNYIMLKQLNYKKVIASGLDVGIIPSPWK